MCIVPRAGGCMPFLYCKDVVAAATDFCVMFSPGAALSDAASGVKFTYSGISNSSAGLPSTNFPIVFPVCEPTLADAAHKLPSKITNKKSTKKLSIMRPAVMKYNFRAHWENCTRRRTCQSACRTCSSSRRTNGRSSEPTKAERFLRRS